MFQEYARSEHPLDIIERLAAFQDWTFSRAETDEMSISVSGRWADYDIALTWIEDVEALHIACAFHLKVPQLRRAEVLNLIARINEQLWVGHFDLWNNENAVIHRQALVLAGGAKPTQSQCETMVNVAIETCERHFQAFQFVVWAGQTAREALDGVLFSTEGMA
ncbi:YbjN domain-containing protein [Microvirga sp. W0021]|uniref:YbjN domain-containing protein n=2 Tax=Hohaiivirga grylli TaxID=3133970 RepID=A0ABV0BJX0_9HYPH